jgi:hypothetical protein
MKKLRSAFYSIDSALLKSPAAFELFSWHFSLIIPTIAFKYLYIRRMSFTIGLRSIIESLGHGIGRYVNLLLLATVDILEVSLIVGLLFMVGRLLLRIPSKALMFASVFLCLMIMGANQYSLLLVANLVTVDTLSISTSWLKEHPYFLWESIAPSQLVFFGLAVLWSSFFAILPSRSVQVHGRLLPFAWRPYSFLLKTIVIGSALGCLALPRMSANFPLVLRGYWSSTVISFFKLDTPKLPTSVLPPLTTIRADYERLVYPRGVEPKPRWLTAVPTAKLTPRHIVIVVLETAPRKYYPLIDNPALPVFYAMSKHAIASNKHYAMSPYTWWNNASIVSGNYFLEKGKGIFDYGDFGSDSVGATLAKHGYTATFIDSFKHSWGRTTGFWKNFGFTNLLDSENDPVPFDRSSYAVSVDKERQSFSRALGAIIDAEGRKSKAVVMLATTIGHYPWLANPGVEGRSNAEKVSSFLRAAAMAHQTEGQGNEEKLYGIAALFDELLGEFLQALTEHGLDEQVLIVVTGDHGLRMRTEFESLGLEVEHGDAAFNVPFLLYGPGLFEKQIRLPYVTSHVDIAPTLLALTGIKGDSWLHHGAHVLDQRLRDRVTFMMNTNLSPVSGFHWRGCHYTLNDLTGKTQVRGSSPNVDSDSVETSKCDYSEAVLPDGSIRPILEAANRHFQITLAYFQHRQASTSK